jgi:Holliday junction resolvase RusA-like endonuclease
MTFMTTFTVDGVPVGKGRPKFARRGNFVSAYTPKKTVDYESTVKAAGQAAMGSQEPLETPVSLYLYVRVPIPASYSKKLTTACLDGLEKPTKKPDADNVLKAISDALNGVCYKDDSQIVNIHLTKVYATVPGVDVCIKECLD